MRRPAPLVAILPLVAATSGLLAFAATPPGYSRVLTIDAGKEWRFHPLILDLNGDGHLDLVATARLADDPLHVWLGDGKGGFTPVRPTWTANSYAALAAGDVNRDGRPDIVAASHFGGVQTLLGDGKGGFAEKLLRREDGYVGAQLGDFDGDGALDLALLGYQKAAVEIYRGDGRGNWSLLKSLQPAPGQSMPGRALLVADLDHDGALDIVAAFQRWGIYIYYGDGRAGFSGGPVSFRAPADVPDSLAVGDVDKDGHLDLVVGGNAGEQAKGPDVYLGDGHRGWKASSAGLKVLRSVSAGLALADVDRDGSLDIVAAGNVTGEPRDGYGLFWFRGDGKGGWSLVPDSGLPSKGLYVPHGIAVADLDHDGTPEIVVLSGGAKGEISIWKR